MHTFIIMNTLALVECLQAKRRYCSLDTRQEFCYVWHFNQQVVDK